MYTHVKKFEQGTAPISTLQQKWWGHWPINNRNSLIKHLSIWHLPHKSELPLTLSICWEDRDLEQHTKPKTISYCINNARWSGPHLPIVHRPTHQDTNGFHTLHTYIASKSPFNAANIMENLPIISKYMVSGKNVLCYSWFPGKIIGRAQGWYAPVTNIINEFASKLCAILTSGV